MACTNTNNLKNCATKTVQTAYNNTVQPFTVDNITINILGTNVCDTGCSASTQTTGFKVLKSGVYRISYDITATATAVGTITAQLYRDTIALPCAIAIVTSAADASYQIHLETEIYISTCCNVQPTFSAQIGGVAGNVTHVCANITKLI